MMFGKKTGMTAAQVRRARAQIAADRCPKKPGLRHRWKQDGDFDTFAGAEIIFYVCTKCGQKSSGVA